MSECIGPGCTQPGCSGRNADAVNRVAGGMAHALQQAALARQIASEGAQSGNRKQRRAAARGRRLMVERKPYGKR